ncbi:hypothetical protein DITRI_Ditri17bG0079800 [Diplodiscus trichospermus]
MQYLQFFLQSMLVSCLFMSSMADDIKIKFDSQAAVIGNTLIVDQSGQGNFTTVQKAIDSVPSSNAAWTRIHVKAGVYSEKVNIPQDKTKILLEGESSRTTIIQFGDFGDPIKSTTFSLNAEDFVAKDITFQNTHNLRLGIKMTWAPAALINADKVSFYRCGFISLQDTLTDSKGRHYFENCYIQGAMDFIWGNGKSIYQGCTLNVTASLIGEGSTAYITAQARDSMNDSTGFVFKNCSILGTGPAYLGRAYKQYARVLFYQTSMSNIIVPEGWSAWHNVGKENSIVYAEGECEGPGADKSKRVPWEKNLSPRDLSVLVNIDTFINEDGWIQTQPDPPLNMFPLQYY